MLSMSVKTLSLNSSKMMMKLTNWANQETTEKMATNNKRMKRRKKKNILN